MYYSCLNLTVKTVKNPLIFDEVTEKNKLAPFMAHGIVGVKAPRGHG